MAYLTTALFLHLSYQRYYWLLLALAGATAQILRSPAELRATTAKRLLPRRGRPPPVQGGEPFGPCFAPPRSGRTASAKRPTRSAWGTRWPWPRGTPSMG